jgi:aspartyl-tRNA(Asn)/glutamyl-tRNA(Gln) amidotransferase subunit B
MPVLHEQLIQLFTVEHQLSVQDAVSLTEEKETAAFYISACAFYSSYKTLCNWISGPVRALQKENGSLGSLQPQSLSRLVQLVDEKKINHATAIKEILPLIYNDGVKDPEKLAIELNLMMEDDAGAAETLVKEVLQSMPDKILEFKKGKKNLMALFIGEAMKKAKGKHNPATIKSAIEKELQ